MVFDAAKRNGRFGCIHCQGNKESSSRKKKKRRVFLCRRTVSVKVRGKKKVLSPSFLKVEGRGRSLGQKTGERGMVIRVGR